MTETALHNITNDYTSAGGSMYRFSHNVAFKTVPIATTLPRSTTNSTYEAPYLIERTAAGPAGEIEHVTAESTAEAIMEIRRLSGLTWEELGDLFDVSRRSVHHWANGKPVTAKHDQMIRRMVATVRHLDQGTQAGTRAFLLLVVDQAMGLSTLDLLKNGRFDEAVGRVEGVRAPKPYRTPLSHAAWVARRPQAQAYLLEAEQERPVIPAKARAVRPMRALKTKG